MIVSTGASKSEAQLAPSNDPAESCGRVRLHEVSGSVTICRFPAVGNDRCSNDNPTLGLLPGCATSGPSGSLANDGLPKAGSWPCTFGKIRAAGNYRGHEARLTGKRLVRMTNPVGMFYLAGRSADVVDHPASMG
jgi:hypothetical protein